MKKLLLVLVVLCGCRGPLGSLERAWPDGASVRLKGLHVQASMTGAGYANADVIEWIGTNGYPLPPEETNVVTIPAGASFRIQR